LTASSKKWNWQENTVGVEMFLPWDTLIAVASETIVFVAEVGGHPVTIFTNSNGKSRQNSENHVERFKVQFGSNKYSLGEE